MWILRESGLGASVQVLRYSSGAAVQVFKRGDTCSGVHIFKWANRGHFCRYLSELGWKTLIWVFGEQSVQVFTCLGVLVWGTCLNVEIFKRAG